MNTAPATPFWKPLAASLLLAMSGGAARAQPLDLLQAWQQAQQSDAAWLAAQASARAGVQVVPIARAALLPQVSLSFQRAHNGVDYTGSAEPQSRYFGGQQSLSLRQPVYRPELHARVDKALAEERDVLAREAAERAALLTRVTEAYFEVLLASDQIALLQAQTDSAQLQLTAAGRARQGGSGTRTDEDEARARLDLLQAQTLEARQALSSARHGLTLLLQRPVDALMALAPAAPAVTAAETPLPELARWLAQAEQGNPELQALQAQIEAAGHEVRRAQAAHQPSVDLQLLWQRSDRDGAANPTARYRQAQASVQMNLPLYAGGGVQAAVRQALAEQERAQHALEAARRALFSNVTREWRAAVEGRARTQAYAQAVHSAEQLVKATQVSFTAGVRSNLDVLDAQERLATARFNHSRTRLQVLVAQLRMAALAGQGDEAVIASVNAQLQTPLSWPEAPAMALSTAITPPASGP